MQMDIARQLQRNVTGEHGPGALGFPMKPKKFAEMCPPKLDSARNLQGRVQFPDPDIFQPRRLSVCKTSQPA